MPQARAEGGIYFLTVERDATAEGRRWIAGRMPAITFFFMKRFVPLPMKPEVWLRGRIARMTLVLVPCNHLPN